MNTKPALAPAGPGRPRAFDMDAAVDTGVALFQARGFEATSLDALTEAMGISRSSFYAAFGSKHGVLLTALRRYSAQRLARLAELARGPEPTRRILGAIATTAGPEGCLLVNCVAELCPADPEVAALGAAHLDRIERIVASGLPADRIDAAPGLVAVALGALTLRKAGRAPDRVDALLDHALARLTADPGPATSL